MARWVPNADRFTQDRAARCRKDEVAWSDNYDSVNTCVNNSYKTWCNSEGQRKARQEVQRVSRLLNTTNCGRETALLKMLTILDWRCSWMRKCLPSMLKAMGSIPDTLETKIHLKNKGGRCSDACLWYRHSRGRGRRTRCQGCSQLHSDFEKDIDCRRRSQNVNAKSETLTL